MLFCLRCFSLELIIHFLIYFVCCLCFIFSLVSSFSLFVFILFISFISFGCFVFLSLLYLMNRNMITQDEIRRPSKLEQRMAIESYPQLFSVLSHINSDETEIEIEETNERIKIPLRALKLLGDILKAMSEGKPISIVPIATEVTTQKAAEILGCSRPHLVKLLEEGEIEFIKVGKHRRVKFEDVIAYRQRMKDEQKRNIIDIMGADEELGLYDS